MKAIRIHEVGGPEALRYEDIPLPEPGEGQVRVKIAAAGVNYADLPFRGDLRPIPLPATPGTEAAGIVDAVGPGVTEFKQGERVAYCLELGAFAEYALVPAARLVAVPEGLDLSTAAAAMVNGLTAHYLTHTTYPLKAGETALIHSAAGGVGYMLVQMAKQRGATVISTVSTPEKAQLARDVGAAHVILYSETDFEEETMRLTKGRGVDVVYDGVGKLTFDKSLNVLRQRGTIVQFGQASGSAGPFDTWQLNIKGSLYLTRPSLRHHIAERESLLQRSGDLFNGIMAGEFKIHIHRVFPLADAVEAHRLLASRQAMGKLLLQP